MGNYTAACQRVDYHGIHGYVITKIGNIGDLVVADTTLVKKRPKHFRLFLHVTSEKMALRSRCLQKPGSAASDLAPTVARPDDIAPSFVVCAMFSCLQLSNLQLRLVPDTNSGSNIPKLPWPFHLQLRSTMLFFLLCDTNDDSFQLHLLASQPEGFVSGNRREALAFRSSARTSIALELVYHTLVVFLSGFSFGRVIDGCFLVYGSMNFRVLESDGAGWASDRNQSCIIGNCILQGLAPNLFR